MRRWNMAAAMALLLAVGATAEAQLIAKSSFEAVPGTGPFFQGQALLPSGWQRVTSTPDTFSNDGSYGIPPGGFGRYFRNFPGVTAFDGTRWVAGAAFGRSAASTTVGGESFGTTLATALTPGQAYRLDAYLYQALRPDLDNPGGYHLFLAAGNTTPGLEGAILLGTLEPTTGADVWEARSLTFVAPADADSRPYLIFSPYQASAGNSYPGIDAVSLGLQP